MDKYKDLIISLIKNHRKYPGCEPILDDIVSDVYEHAKSVIESVHDDTIITAYLTKVVSTSMITVPKRLNINNRERSMYRQGLAVDRRIQITDSNEVIVNDNISDEQPEQLLNEIDLSEMEDNLIDNTSITEELVSSDDNINEIEAEQDLEQQETIVDSAVPEATDLTEDDLNINENEVELEENLEENDVETFVEEEAPEDRQNDVNMELVDKMINGVSDIQNDNLELSDAETLEYEDLDDLTTADTLDSDIENELIEEAIEEEEDNFVELNDELTVEDITEDTDIESDGIPLSENDNNSDEVEFCPPNFNCFDYKPEFNFNEDEICDSLKQIDTEYPNKHIMAICELKYKQKKSVTEISKELDLSEEAVIETLREIIGAVN